MLFQVVQPSRVPEGAGQGACQLEAALLALGPQGKQPTQGVAQNPPGLRPGICAPFLFYIRKGGFREKAQVSLRLPGKEFPLSDGRGGPGGEIPVSIGTGIEQHSRGEVLSVGGQFFL